MYVCFVLGSSYRGLQERNDKRPTLCFTCFINDNNLNKHIYTVRSCSANTVLVILQWYSKKQLPLENVTWSCSLQTSSNQYRLSNVRSCCRCLRCCFRDRSI